MSSVQDLPDLLGSDALMQFLKDGLQQLEADQGFTDDEARGLLLQLQQQTVLMQTLAGHQQEQQRMTDIQIAQQIDSVDAQLAQLEAALSSADAATKQLLGQSTSKWMNTGDQSSPSQQQRGSTSSNGHAPAVAAAEAPTQELPAEAEEVDTAGHALQHEQSGIHEAEQQTLGIGPGSCTGTSGGEHVQQRQDVASGHQPQHKKLQLD